MGHARESIYIDAPPDEVWSIGTDPNRLPEWNTTAVEVKDVIEPLDQPGGQYTVVSKIAGRPVEITWHVEKVERPKFGELTATTPLGGSARQRVDFEPEGNGTRVTVDIEFEIASGLLGQVISKVFAERSLERDVRHSAENFKALVEEQRAGVAAGG